MKTSERILEQARCMFNEQGVAAVSTADIAEALHISPGNLYYHFNNKQDLLVQLCEQCHQRLRPILAMLSIGQASWQELHMQLIHLLEIIAHYVFIFQDTLQICRLSIKLRHRLQWMRQQLHDTFNDLLSGYIEHGVLQTNLDIQQIATQMSQHCWFVFVDQPLQRDAALKQQQMDLALACEQLLSPLTLFIVPGSMHPAPK
jgi:AcrR family transcriptional regulator